MNELKEIWITTNNSCKQYNTIIAVSNKGKHWHVENGKRVWV